MHLNTLKRLHKTPSGGPRYQNKVEMFTFNKQSGGGNVTFPLLLLARCFNLCTIPFLNVFSRPFLPAANTPLHVESTFVCGEGTFARAGPCVSDSGYFCSPHTAEPQLWDPGLRGPSGQCGHNHTPSASLYLALQHAPLPLLFALPYNALLGHFTICDTCMCMLLCCPVLACVIG